jgi:acyl-CoA thioester hydrolase
MAAFTTRRRVEFRDTDAAGIVHFSAFFLWMESAEHELLRQLGVRVVERIEAGASSGSDAGDGVVSWPRVSASCDYTAAVRFGDEVDITVTVADIGRSSVTYAFGFVHAGKPVAQGRVVAVRCLMHAGRRPEPVPIPADIVALLERYRAA